MMKYIIITVLVIITAKASNANNFEPYELNGGLVSGIAGPDYILLAADTRLSKGYTILSRNHLNTRIFSLDEQHNHPINLESIKDGEQIECGSKSFMAMSGCLADCIELKQHLMRLVHVHCHWISSNNNNTNNGDGGMAVSSMATLLGTTLFSRRAFPFYSFCLLAGFDHHHHNYEASNTNSGAVYIYDAIGSFERVATAASGTGKELLQPILDRLFASSSSTSKAPSLAAAGAAKVDDDNDTESSSSFVPVSKQRARLSLNPPVRTVVECSVEEAIERVVHAYRSVTEREICVGDELVVCVIQTNKELNDKGDKVGRKLLVRRFPLKKH